MKADIKNTLSKHEQWAASCLVVYPELRVELAGELSRLPRGLPVLVQPVSPEFAKLGVDRARDGLRQAIILVSRMHVLHEDYEIALCKHKNAMAYVEEKIRGRDVNYIIEFIDRAVSARIKAAHDKKLRENSARVDFYSSPEWRRLRYRALKMHGGSCQCCGARPSPKHPLHVDHIKPRSRFPELALEVSNLQILCEDCNLGKGARDQTDWRDA